jgi:hypothetical protein
MIKKSMQSAAILMWGMALSPVFAADQQPAQYDNRTDEAPGPCYDPSHPRRVDLSKPICATQPAPTARQTAADAQRYFNRTWVDGQIGRVGYHMTAKLQVMKSDEPAGCYIYFDTWEIKGDLPPGLSARSSDASFEGTPRQPGEWNIPVILHGIGCSNTGKTYGDREINVHFRIDP